MNWFSYAYAKNYFIFKLDFDMLVLFIYFIMLEIISSKDELDNENESLETSIFVIIFVGQL